MPGLGAPVAGGFTGGWGVGQDVLGAEEVTLGVQPLPRLGTHTATPTS